VAALGRRSKAIPNQPIGRRYSPLWSGGYVNSPWTIDAVLAHLGKMAAISGCVSHWNCWWNCGQFSDLRIAGSPHGHPRGLPAHPLNRREIPAATPLMVTLWPAPRDTQWTPQDGRKDCQCPQEVGASERPLLTWRSPKVVVGLNYRTTNQKKRHSTPGRPPGALPPLLIGASRRPGVGLQTCTHDRRNARPRPPLIAT
jgi:hypothetical protein